MVDENLSLRAELEGTLERDLEGAARAADRLGDEAQETALQLAIMGRAAAGSARDVRDYESAMERAEKRHGALSAQQQRSQAYYDSMAKSVVRSRTETDKHTSALDRFLSIMKKVDGQGFDFAKILKVYKIPAIITAVTLLATAVGALGAAGYAAIAGLSPLVPLIGAALPAALLAGGQALAAVKMGFSGVGDAVKALAEGDAEKAAEALAKLTPEARRLARELGALTAGPLKDMKDSVASAMLPGFYSGLRDVSGLLPMLTNRLTGTGRVISGLAKDAGEVMGSDLFSDQLSRIMATNNVAIDNGGRAMGRLGQAVLHVVDAFRPVTRMMSESALAVATYIEASAEAGNSTGRMSAFFKDAWGLAKDVGSAVADLTVGLFNIGKEADALADSMGGGLGDAFADLRSWTESSAGRESIRGFFEDAIPVVEQFGGLVLDVMKMFGRLATDQSLAPLIAQIRTELLPALEALMGMTTGKLGPAIVSLATSFLELANVLTFSPILEVLQVFAEGVALATSAVESFPGPVKTAIATIAALGIAFKLLQGTLNVTRTAFSPLTQTISGFAGKAVTSANETGRAMTGLERAADAARRGFVRLTPAGRDAAASMQSVSRMTANVYGPIGQIGSASQRTSSQLTGLQSQLRVTGGAMGGLRAAGAGLMGAMGGPWGLAITGVIVGLTMWGKSNAEAESRIAALTDTLDKQTGAVTQNTREMVANSLEKSGALEAARALGISLADVTDAALGNADALARINAVADENVGYTGAMGKGFNKVSDEQVALAENSRLLLRVLGDQGGEVAASVARWDRLSEATGETVDAANGVPPALQKAGVGLSDFRARGEEVAGLGLSDFMDDTSRATWETERATKALWQATDQLRTAQMKMLGGDIAFQASLDDLSATMREGAKTLNINSAAGRENVQAMMDLAAAAGGVTGGAKKQHAALVQAHGEIVKWAKAAGMGQREAEKYANGFIHLKDTIDDVPKDPEIELGTRGVPEAINGMDNVKGAVDRVPGSKTVHVGVDDQATYKLEGVRQKLYDIAGTYIANLTANIKLNTLRKDGGPVWPGTTFTVGEVGPELLLKASGGVDVIGATGREQRRFSEPGIVLPNEVYEAAKVTDRSLPTGVLAALDRRTAPATPSRRPSASTGGSDGGPPVKIVNQFHGVKDAAEAERLAAGAVRGVLQELKERKIHHGWDEDEDIDGEY